MTEYLTVPRALRARRIITRAAELLEAEAAALKECHTIDGQWRDEPEEENEARFEHDEMIEIATDLRGLL